MDNSARKKTGKCLYGLLGLMVYFQANAANATGEIASNQGFKNNTKNKQILITESKQNAKHQVSLLTNLTSQKPRSGLKRFNDWKADKIQALETKARLLSEQQKKLSIYNTNNTKDPNNHLENSNNKGSLSRDLAIVEAELRTVQGNLELAKDLSMSDYFVGYINRFSDKNKVIKELAPQLSPEEVAELMAAYADSFFMGNAIDLPTTANSTTSELK